MNDLGQKQSGKQFLTHLIPSTFDETVYKGRKHWACDVKGFALSKKEWEKIQNDIKDTFGDNLIEISSRSSLGIRFVVYLRRDT